MCFWAPLSLKYDYSRIYTIPIHQNAQVFFCVPTVLYYGVSLLKAFIGFIQWGSKAVEVEESMEHGEDEG